MKKLVLIGASGSIGSQTIDIICKHIDEFELVGVAVGHNDIRLIEILNSFKSIRCACIEDEKKANMIQKMFPDVKIVYGDEGLCTLASMSDYDMFVNAVVGFRGLKPTLVAIENKKDIALANKETLVTGGDIVKQYLKKYDVNLYPIDSEHSAIFQCLQGNEHKNISRLIITASGGSFRDKTRDELKNVSVKEALHHPNWSMGGRITIDSATMMNKGFEVIEAHYLFDIPYDKIDVLIHYESAIHSMVEYCDQAIIAQIGTADMRIPIQYALSYPKRLPLNEKSFDFLKYSTFHFKEVDETRYPLIKLAYEVGKKGGNLGAIMNGADEEAVSLFLNEKISFLDIETSIIEAVKNIPYIEQATLEDIIDADASARKYVRELWKEHIHEDSH